METFKFNWPYTTFDQNFMLRMVKINNNNVTITTTYIAHYPSPMGKFTYYGLQYGCINPKSKARQWSKQATGLKTRNNIQRSEEDGKDMAVKTISY